MFSKNQAKYIRSLAQQKYRKEHQSYVVEGDKIVREWLNSDEKIELIAGTEDWLGENAPLVQRHETATIVTTAPNDLDAVSSLKTPNKALAVVRHTRDNQYTETENWTLALDTIQDPGNMGTIIRIADWFGVSTILATPDSVDYYNPKVIQAAMGGHLRVNLVTADLNTLLSQSTQPVYAALLDGDDIYDLQRVSPGIILMGNESKGIRPELINDKTKKITIPRKGGAESLNVAVATGIICSLMIR